MYPSAALRNTFDSAPIQRPNDAQINADFKDAMDFYAAHNSIVVKPAPKPPLAKVKATRNLASKLKEHNAHRLSNITEKDEDVLSLRSASPVPAVPPKSSMRTKSMPSRIRPVIQNGSVVPPVPLKNPARLYAPLVTNPATAPLHPQRNAAAEAPHSPYGTRKLSPSSQQVNPALSPVAERSEVSLAPKTITRKTISSVKAYFERAGERTLSRNTLHRSREWLRDAAAKYGI